MDIEGGHGLTQNLPDTVAGCRALSNKSERGAQCRQRICWIDGTCLILLAEFSSARIESQGQVQVARDGQAEDFMQEYLARRRVEQVGPAHDFVDALLRIIDDHRELVGEETVSPAYDKITNFTIELLDHGSADPIRERDGTVINAHAPA